MGCQWDCPLGGADKCGIPPGQSVSSLIFPYAPISGNLEESDIEPVVQIIQRVPSLPTNVEDVFTECKALIAAWLSVRMTMLRFRRPYDLAILCVSKENPAPTPQSYLILR